MERPKGQRVVGCRWLFRIKEGVGENSKPRYKARLVARGFTQVPKIDFNELFSPVVRHTSIRVLLAITTQLNLQLEQMDVTTAFLHGDLEERIYMDQPKGFEAKGEVEKVCLLRKSLYGLKQSPRQWYRKFDSVMINQGYLRSSYDCCIYFKHVTPNVYVYLLLYVDDMLIASQSTREI